MILHVLGIKIKKTPYFFSLQLAKKSKDSYPKTDQPISMNFSLSITFHLPFIQINKPTASGIKSGEFVLSFSPENTVPIIHFIKPKCTI